MPGRRGAAVVNEPTTENGENSDGSDSATGNDSTSGDLPETARVGRGNASYADVANLTFLSDDDLPVETKAGTRSHTYTNLLNAVKADCEATPSHIGMWVPIAKFATNQGANSVINGVREGKIEIPEGKFEWRTSKYDRADGKGRGSQLYVRWMGD